LGQHNKKDNTAIDLSAIASGTGGFVINGENVNDSWASITSTNNQIIQAIAINRHRKILCHLRQKRQYSN
jgi:hypothetical protein